MYGPTTYTEHRRQQNKAAAARCYARAGYSSQLHRTQTTAATAPLITQLRAAQPPPAAADVPSDRSERKWSHAAAPDAVPAADGVWLNGIFVSNNHYWEDDEGELWDWLTVKGLQHSGSDHSGSDTDGIQVLLQWDPRQDNGRLWPDSWEPVSQCNGLWEWLYWNRAQAPRVGAYWEEWVAMITAQYRLVAGDSQ